MEFFNQFDRGVFVVNVLAIIFDPETKKILIGRRKDDRYIEKLTWCFPGGRPAYDKDLEEYVEIEVKGKAGIEVEVQNIIFAKTYPEDRKFLSIYYLCHAKSQAAEAAGSFVEVKWINPGDVEKYFTTSIHSTLLRYLQSLK